MEANEEIVQSVQELHFKDGWIRVILEGEPALVDVTARSFERMVQEFSRETGIAIDRALGICAIMSYSGPNGEPLACAYLNGHEGVHSWATLPTFSNGVPVQLTEADRERMMNLERVAALANDYLDCTAEFGDSEPGCCAERLGHLGTALDKLGGVYRVKGVYKAQQQPPVSPADPSIRDWHL